MNEIALKTFEKWLKSQGKRSRTIRHYTYLINRVPEELINTPKAMNTWLENSGFTVKTIDGIASALRTYYMSIDMEDRIRFIKKPKYKRDGKTDYLTIETINKMLEKCNDYELLVIRLLFECGIRKSILHQLTIKDLDLKNNKITVRGKYDGSKTGTTYQVYISDDTKNLMIKHMKENKLTRVKTVKQLIFPELSEFKTYYLIKKVGKKAGITKNVYPHILRHSFSTYFWNKTKNLKALQRARGDKYVTSSETYIHISEEEIKKEFDKFLN